MKFLKPALSLSVGLVFAASAVQGSATEAPNPPGGDAAPAAAEAAAKPRYPKRPTKEEIEKHRELTRPGPEHDEMAKLAGYWNVTVKQGRSVRNGGGRSYMILDKRFLWIGCNTGGRAGNLKAQFTIGFDRRHGRYSLMAIDTDGTYFVTAHGKRDAESGKIKLYGKDDDPYMKSLGFEKEFAHALDFSDPDRFVIEVFYIDTRTPERKEMKGMEFLFERKPKPEAQPAAQSK